MNHTALIQNYFSGFSAKQLEQFASLPALYTEWNAKINVVSRADIDHLMERHVLHALAIAKVLEPKSGSAILDVGTGGGFPGIPLAIAFPNVHFHLVDSIGKKIAVVHEIAHALELTNVHAKQSRMEDLKGEYHYITHRAVKPMAMLMGWTKHLLVKGQNGSLRNGWIGLKGGDLSDELKGLRHTLYPISNWYAEPFFETKQVVYVPF